MAIRVTLENHGDAPLNVPVAESDFVVVIESHAHVETYPVPHYDSFATAVTDTCVPLRPGSSYTWSLPVSVNDFGGIPEKTWVGTPGTYNIRVRYTPAKGCEHQPAETWLQRPLTSQRLVFRIAAPSLATVASWRRRLATCVHDDACNGFEAANCYRVVKDDHAAGLLLQLLAREPTFTWLLDAIVFQSRPRDALRLASLAA